MTKINPLEDKKVFIGSKTGLNPIQINQRIDIQLQLELERLMRDVEIQTQVFITLQQQYELARIEEVKETPSVVTLDLGKPAIRKEKPKRILLVITE